MPSSSDPDNKLVETRSDHIYYVMTPHLVWAMCLDPYDLALWLVIKMIAGESGECYLSTPDLAAAAMMSSGKCSQCRDRLLKAGLIEGRIVKDPGYPQPVFHLTIPDLWPRNLRWRERNHSLTQRIQFKRDQKSLHQVKPSPGEQGLSPGERGLSPGETKKNHENNQKEEEYRALWKATLTEIAYKMTRPTFNTWLRATHLCRLTEDRSAALISCPTAYVLEWLSQRLNRILTATLADILNIKHDAITLHYIVLAEDATEEEIDLAEQLAFTT